MSSTSVTEVFQNTINDDIYVLDRLDKYGLDSFDNRENEEVIRFNGFGSPLEIKPSSSHQSDLIIQIINSPYSMISNLNLINTTIELINSPYSEISNNVIQDISNHGSTEIISVINSSHSFLSNNMIQKIDSSRNQTVGISVRNSNNVTISGNIIEEIYTTIYERTGDLTSAILILDSYNITVNSNHINNIRGSSSAGIQILNSGNNLIYDNQISQIENIISSRTEAFGIFLFNSTDSQIFQNYIQTILSNSEVLIALSFGISVLDVSNVIVNNNTIDNIEAFSDSPQTVGITISNATYVQINDNQISNISAISEIESRGIVIGIELSSSYFVKLKNNNISNIISHGRTAYGISVDTSEDIEFHSNLIDTIKTTSIYVTNAEGIILRDSNRTLLSGNLIHNIIAEIIPSEIQPIFPRIATSVGITIFEVINISISDHHISQVEALTTNVPADAMGMIISYTQFIKLSFNTIKEIITLDTDGLSLGILISRSKYSEVLHNNLTSIVSNGFVYYIQQVFSRNLVTSYNSLTIEGEKEVKGGLYAIKVHSLTISNNVVHLNQSTLGFQTVVISFSDLFNITNNNLVDVKNNSVGILLRSAINGTIDFNYIDSFLLWIEMTNESININCNSNHINNVIHNSCPIGEYVNINDLVPDEYSGFNDEIQINTTNSSIIRIVTIANTDKKSNFSIGLIGGLIFSGVVGIFFYIRKKR
ncbi:MAG: hypothetical protein GPJ54_11840 [Candidatus Heimdallarchaeota archaeon]|nr:hypothetical protein [Candidatus Heimdallarchaeota archaeon]